MLMGNWQNRAETIHDVALIWMLQSLSNRGMGRQAWIRKANALLSQATAESLETTSLAEASHLDYLNLVLRASYA